MRETASEPQYFREIDEHDRQIGSGRRPTAPLTLSPLNPTSLRDQAYALLKNAIAETDIYDPAQELRLDERQLTAALGVSRTPIREALSLLEQEGFIRTVPRRGIYIMRKSKREIIEMIQMWAALESMAARLATLHAPQEEIAKLGTCSTSFRTRRPPSICASTRTRTSPFIRRSSRWADRRPWSMRRAIF